MRFLVWWISSLDLEPLDRTWNISFSLHVYMEMSFCNVQMSLRFAKSFYNMQYCRMLVAFRFRHIQISHQLVSSVLLQSHFAPLHHQQTLFWHVLAVLSREGREQFILSLQGTFFEFRPIRFSHIFFPFHMFETWNSTRFPWQGPLGPKVDSWGTSSLVFSGRKRGFSLKRQSGSTLSGRFWCSNKQSSGPSFEWHDLGMSARTRMAVDIHPILHPCDSVFT